MQLRSGNVVEFSSVYFVKFRQQRKVSRVVVEDRDKKEPDDLNRLPELVYGHAEQLNGKLKEARLKESSWGGVWHQNK